MNKTNETVAETSTSLKFCPLASSSKGNCIFISYNNTKILIDIGISCKKLKDSLAEIGENIEDLDGIFITHIHSDHIRGLDVTYRKYNIPIYATEKTWTHIIRHEKVKNLNKSDINYVYKYENIFVNDLIIKIFEVPHDTTCAVGYSVFLNGLDGYKISVATDLGHATPEVLENIKGTNLLFIESNHDIDMLKNGKYPLQLKERVLSKRGHLSNVSAGELIIETYHENMEYIFLGHLSDENNLPMIAYDTVYKILDSNNIIVGEDVKLFVADKTFTSELLIRDITFA